MNSQNDIAAINELYDLWGVSAHSGDLDLFMSIWTGDAIRMGQDAPAVVGWDAIRASTGPLLEQFDLHIEGYGETEVEVSGDLAFSRGTYTMTLTPKEGGPTTFIDGKWLDILKRQADGSWKIYCDCYNNNAPPKVD
mgnify:FL=1